MGLLIFIQLKLGGGGGEAKPLGCYHHVKYKIMPCTQDFTEPLRLNNVNVTVPILVIIYALTLFQARGSLS